ncbi:MAG: glycine hydroxymethyltransferase [Cellvibrionaceae bacterium]|jgi:glycine hydroxymethyltransferase
MFEDFVFRGTVAELDPQLHELLERERFRQEKTIILIASESEAPEAVEEAMGSKFGNIYAEGYPRENSRRQSEDEILDFETELAIYRRDSDPRYYKGVEYADVVEALCRRRAADLFAANGVKPEDMYVNVQPLSGGPANSALYTAIMKPGDTIMGLKLSDGGHLSHGAPVNRSGTIFKSVSYIVDPETEQLDYEEIREMALEVKPKVIVAGFSAYPRIINWHAFRAIADEVGAHFHADIAHISGLVAAGHHPSPIGIADSVMTTTHKSLCGPRGAMLMTHRKDIGLKIDKAVFPGEQGGAHFNTIGALALALKLAQTDQFTELQNRIMRNATRLAEKLAEQGLRIVGGGSENHLLLVDVTGTKNHYGLSLEGDSAARILDVAGIVTNRNTIPGDRSAFIPSGLRLGTVWISQLGFGDAEIDKLAEAIGIIVNSAVPIEYGGPIRKRTRRTKISREALQKARVMVRELTKQPEETIEANASTLRVRGFAASAFVGQALGSHVAALADGEAQASKLMIDGDAASVTVKRESADVYWLRFSDGGTAATAKLFLQDLSDGYTLIGNDAYAKVNGPVVVENGEHDGIDVPKDTGESFEIKPFYVGQPVIAGEGLPEFDFEAVSMIQAGSAISATVIRSGAMLSADGVAAHYGDINAELAAIKGGAALVDESTKSIFVAAGPHARDFIDAVYTNEVGYLKVGDSNLGFLLTPAGTVLDMVTVTRKTADEYVLVGSAKNAAKVGKWLTAVNSGSVLIDSANPASKVVSCHCYEASAAYVSAADGKANWVLLSLQGPEAVVTLEQAGLTHFAHAVGKGFDLFVPAADADGVWTALVKTGATPTGEQAIDRSRTIAGIAVIGAEVGGNIDPDGACYGDNVKLWKPFFVGRAAYIKTYESPQKTIVRFEVRADGAIPAVGSPIFDGSDGSKEVGSITSIALNASGTSLIGMAFVPLKYRKKGSKLSVSMNGENMPAPILSRFA